MRTSDEFDAMAAQVGKLSSQRIRDADHVKAVLAKREVEMEDAKARWQQEAAQKLIEYQDQLKITEQPLSQVPSPQAMQDQRSQRELDIIKDAFQARNPILEEKLAKQQQSDDELRIAKDIFSFQIIESCTKTSSHAPKKQH